MRKFDLSLRSSRSSYFATFRHQLTILSKTDRSEERFSRNAETDLVCRLLLEKKNKNSSHLTYEFFVFCLLLRRSLSSTLFPYTTLFRSILIKQELLLLVYELNRSGLLAENEKIRPILAQLEKLLLCDLSPSTNDSVKN